MPRLNIMFENRLCAAMGIVRSRSLLAGRRLTICQRVTKRAFRTPPKFADDQNALFYE